MRARAEAAWPIARCVGVDHPVVRSLGLRPPSPTAERRIPIPVLDVLWDTLVERDGPAAPLAVASRVRASSYGVLTYLLGCAPSGRHALRRLSATYRELLSEGTSYEVNVERGHVEVDVRLHGGPRAFGATLFAVAAVVGFIASEVEGAPRPRSARLALPPPPPERADAFARFFAGVVEYRAPSCRLVYERAAVERRLHGSDPALAEILEHCVRQRRPAPRPMARALREALRALGPSAPPSQAEAASSLGVSPRSLRRRLAEEQTSFQAELDHVRRRWAEAGLAAPGARVGSLARALGYADAAAFRRAFRRWTGMSPQTWIAVSQRAHRAH